MSCTSGGRPDGTGARSARPSQHMRSIAAVLLLAAVSARADAIADLERTLAALRGTSSIAATYDAHHTNKAHGRFFNQNLNVHSVAEVQVSEAGVTLTLSRATLERLRAQRATEHGDQSNIDEEG